ncbi:MAG: type II toxin-antitoxin system RelE/ParE family toxin [Deltaproteobacteria bacterium]|nr:type II toxin-antitoxin system RelE/ParE family toxin [Deltaproteobacteria bacterium]
MTYSVEVSRTAERQIRSLDRPVQVRVLRVIMALSVNPRPAGHKKLAGYDDVFRIRVGDYRVLYSIDGRQLVVIVLKVGHRRAIYR